MNGRKYENNLFLHKPDELARQVFRGPDALNEYLTFTELAYDQLIHDATVATEIPGCLDLTNRRVLFGQDQAVSAPITEVLENIVAWYTFYEQKLYNEGLTT